MTDDTSSADPWAWARQDDADGAAVRVSPATVTVVIVAHQGERWLKSAIDSVTAQNARPTRLVVVDAGSDDKTAQVASDARTLGRVQAVVQGVRDASFGANVAQGLQGLPADEWLWLLHDDVVADASALDRLLDTAVQGPADVVGPLLLEAGRRRGRAVRVSEAGQTMTESGVITGVVPEGMVDQGQLESTQVLGLNSCGMLVRRSVWDELGGFDDAVPSGVQGLEFCWRARLAGYRVVTQPRARVVHVEASTRGIRDNIAVDPHQDKRRWGLALHEAFRSGPMSSGERGRLGAESLRRVLGFVVGKDLLDARLERAAVREWRGDRASVDRLHQSYLSATQGSDRSDEPVGALRLTRKALRTRRLDETFGRITDWLSAFGDRGGGLGLEALTGDDFARDDQTKRRISPVWVLAWVFIVGALVASRGLLSFAPLSGPQLLEVPDSFGGLFARYAAGVSGADPSAGAPWVGLVWAASLLTLGHPDLIVSLVLLGAVPVCFLLASRVLGRLADDRWVVLGGAACYALVPVLTGAVASGQLGAVAWAIALPLLAGRLVTWWQDGEPSWPVVGGVGLAATVMTAAEPLTWVAVVAAVGVLAWRLRHGWIRPAVAAVSPLLLLVTPFTAELARFPGRLLTGTEPLLVPTNAMSRIELLLGRAAPEAAPVWVAAATLGVIWLLALTGAVLNRRAAWAVAVALGSAAVAVVLTRIVVTVQPTGIPTHPQATAWIVGMAGALIWAAVLGLDGLRESIAESTFDRRHALVYAVALLACGAVAIGSGWWVALGHAELERRGGSSVPTFIRKDAARDSCRIVTLDLRGDHVSWNLLEGDFGRLGDAERGLAFGGSQDGTATAQSVVHRLAQGSADERIVSDLQSLGVCYLWVTGASPDQRVSISNVPGLGVGAADADGASWIVPDSGRLVLVSGEQTTRVDPGSSVPAGGAGRVLLVADPTSPALAVRIGEALATRLPDVAGRAAFAVPDAGGAVTLNREGGVPWWAGVQAALLIALLALAAPASPSASDARARTPRHVRRGV